ncbi:Astra associated protein 1 Asa1, partial [Coemansia sp. RSA 2618]
MPDFVFRGHQASVNCVHFLANGRFLVSGDQDGRLIVWSMLLKRQLTSINAHSSAILAISSLGTNNTADPFTLLTQGRDNKLHTWTLHTREFDASLELAATQPIESLNFCRFANADQWVVGLLAGEDKLGRMFLYNAKTQYTSTFSVKRGSNAREDQPMCVALCAEPNSDGLLLMVGYESNAVQCFHLRVSGDPVQASRVFGVQAPHKEPLMGVAVDRGNGRIYTCAADSKVCCFGFDGSVVSETAEAEMAHPGGSMVRCFDEPKIVAVPGWDYALHLYDHGLRHIRDVRFHRAALTCVDVSVKCMDPLVDIADELVQQRWRAQPQWMAVASRDERISIWDIQN